MGNKCEWKEGWEEECGWEGSEFSPCSMYDANYEMSENGKTFSMQTGYNSWNHCPYCGANIQKPKLEITIKKDGDTYAAKFNGTDYICTHPNSWHGVAADIANEVFLQRIVKPEGGWAAMELVKPVEIINLHPMIKCIKGGERISMEIHKLIHIEDKQAFYIKTHHNICANKYYSFGWMHMDNVELCTVEDLP